MPNQLAATARGSSTPVNRRQLAGRGCSPPRPYRSHQRPNQALSAHINGQRAPCPLTATALGGHSNSQEPPPDSLTAAPAQYPQNTHPAILCRRCRPPGSIPPAKPAARPVECPWLLKRRFHRPGGWTPRQPVAKAFAYKNQACRRGSAGARWP